MIKNYLKIAFRNILRHTGFTFINISGLAIGLASCILILLFVIDELQYEKFHEKAEDIYLIGLDGKLGNEEFRGQSTCYPLAFTMVDEFPEVIQATRVNRRSQIIIQYENIAFSEQNLYYVDSTFFDVFTFPLIEGDPNTALAKPNSIIFTEESAIKYFGTTENIIGKIVSLNNETDLEITALAKNPPHQTHLQFDFLVSMNTRKQQDYDNWGSNNLQTYIVLDKDADPEKVDAKFFDLLDKYFGPIIQQIMNTSYTEFVNAGNRYIYFTEPLLDLHLHSSMTENFESGSDIVYIWALSLIAAFILLIACVNFVNLSTAKASLRAKEVGIRKTIGAKRKQLIWQFLSESFLMSLFAMLVALIIVETVLPHFNNLTKKELVVGYFSSSYMVPFLLGLTIFTGLVAGAYAAFFQSNYSILSVLKGKRKRAMRTGGLRNVLVVFQFSISIFLIICTIVVVSQIRYFQKKDLGFDKEQILVIKRIDLLQGKHKAFKQEVMKHPAVLKASNSYNVPTKGFNGNGILKEGGKANEVHILQRFVADYDILETFGIELKEGRFFSPKYLTDSTALVINEAAIPSLELENPLETMLIEPSDLNFKRPVIGVVKDFHLHSPKSIIYPMCFELLPEGYNANFTVIRFNPENISDLLNHVETTWNNIISGQPFEYFFMDEEFNKTFTQERELRSIYAIFAILAIFIACLGLFGLAAFASEQRTKEIGIRKAMGGQVGGLMVLLATDFTKWVLLANVIAWPGAFFMMKSWLNNFAYRIDMNIFHFVLASIISLLIALLTVGYQSLKAARTNPVQSLRYE